MPTISFASPKGGAGKTTSALLLATELARKGAGVTLIDADPNMPISKWQRRGGAVDHLAIVRSASEKAIIDEIEQAARETAFVIADLEGTANLGVAWAVSMSDLVIIPTQGSPLDSDEAAKAIRLIKGQEKASRRRIAHAILLTRTSAAIRPRSLKHLQSELTKHEIEVLATQLIERDAYRAMFAFAAPLEALDPKEVSGLQGAIANARTFAGEVVERLKALEGGPDAARVA